MTTPTITIGAPEAPQGGSHSHPESVSLEQGAIRLKGVARLSGPRLWAGRFRRPLLAILGLVVALVAVVVLSGTLTGYALAADRVRGWLGETRMVKLVRRAMAGLMAGAAIAILTR